MIKFRQAKNYAIEKKKCFVFFEYYVHFWRRFYQAFCSNMNRVRSEFYIPTLIRKVKIARKLSGSVAGIFRAHNCIATTTFGYHITEKMDPTKKIIRKSAHIFDSFNAYCTRYSQKDWVFGHHRFDFLSPWVLECFPHASQIHEIVSFRSKSIYGRDDFFGWLQCWFVHLS